MLESFDHRRYLIPFRSLLLPHIFTDTLVIGSGVAGLRAAIEAQRHGDVIVLAKQAVDVSSTAWAQGGVAAVTSKDDSIDDHIRDTCVAGAGLCDEDVVQRVVRNAGREIEQLIKWGMRFDREADGDIALGREGGHSAHRILHSDGDATGRELIRCLVEHVRSLDNIRIFEQCFALDLLTVGSNGRDEPTVLGAITHHPKHGLQIIWARATILASGGAGQVYRETTTPAVTTGDGLAMAYRAGAALADLEFMQFHPTTLYVAGASRTLITEAVRGEGAKLIDRAGNRFMPEYHELAELAPRDVVARAIVDRLEHSQEPCVYLDARHLGRDGFRRRFPGLARQLAKFDLDAGSDLIPVRPCAHYTIGGVLVDEAARTNLPGLYACGEVSCSGLHGANRLASNSLLEGLVLGQAAGAAVAGIDTQATPGPRQIISDIPISEHGELDLSDVRSSLRSAMWRNVGIQRHGGRLNDAGDMFQFWARYTMDKIFDDPAGWETQNLLTVGAMIARAAVWRQESRGVHFRIDYPDESVDFLKRTVWRANQAEPATLPAGITADDTTPQPA